MYTCKQLKDLQRKVSNSSQATMIDDFKMNDDTKMSDDDDVSTSTRNKCLKCNKDRIIWIDLTEMSRFSDVLRKDVMKSRCHICNKTFDYIITSIRTKSLIIGVHPSDIFTLGQLNSRKDHKCGFCCAACGGYKV